MSGAPVNAHVLRQDRSTGTGGHGVRVRDGWPYEQHDAKRVRSDQSVHLFRSSGVQLDQDPIRTRVQTVPGGAV